MSLVYITVKAFQPIFCRRRLTRKERKKSWEDAKKFFVPRRGCGLKWRPRLGPRLVHNGASRVQRATRRHQTSIGNFASRGESATRSFSFNVDFVVAANANHANRKPAKFERGIGLRIAGAFRISALFEVTFPFDLTLCVKNNFKGSLISSDPVKGSVRWRLENVDAQQQGGLKSYFTSRFKSNFGFRRSLRGRAGSGLFILAVSIERPGDDRLGIAISLAETRTTRKESVGRRFLSTRRRQRSKGI